MKGEPTKNLKADDIGIIRFYGNRYRARIVAVYKTRVLVRFKLSSMKVRERTVPVTWDRLRFENAHTGVFLAPEVRGEKPKDDGPPGLKRLLSW